jgi:hypothetical protein
VAGFSTFFAWKIWKLTDYQGMWWLAISIFYAFVLRILILFSVATLTTMVVYLMVFFWIGLCYSLYRLYKKIKKIMK